MAVSITDKEKIAEIVACYRSPEYFIRTYARIYDSERREWIPFEMWEEQVATLALFHEHKKVIVLKARQLGLTWLALSYALWHMLFEPIAVVLLFSRREQESMDLLDRLKDMYKQLPEWLQSGANQKDTQHEWQLDNLSEAIALTKSGGDSYAATLVVADEFDLYDDATQRSLYSSIEPTVNAGRNKLFLISRSDKSKPQSYFKSIYRAARGRLNDFTAVFLPWYVRPSRTKAWYQERCDAAMEETGALDFVYEQYPASDDEALRASELDKRISPKYLNFAYAEENPLPVESLPTSLASIAGLRVYRLPEAGKKYIWASDSAEGLPSSDDSVTQMLERDTLEQVAVLSGKLSPAVHASATQDLSSAYNNARGMPESNNHGHAFILAADEQGWGGRILKGHDKKRGWTSNARGKYLMYDKVQKLLLEQRCTIHDAATYYQLQSIERSTLRAPDGEMDDHADAFAIAVAAAEKRELVFI